MFSHQCCGAAPEWSLSTGELCGKSNTGPLYEGGDTHIEPDSSVGFDADRILQAANVGPMRADSCNLMHEDV